MTKRQARELQEAIDHLDTMGVYLTANLYAKKDGLLEAVESMRIDLDTIGGIIGTIEARLTKKSPPRLITKELATAAFGEG